MYDLFRRFTPGLALPLTATTILSPAILPSLNLMLDVPCLALGLGSMAIFFRACDDDSVALAALAGALGGAAMQIKYSGVQAPAAMMIYALIHRRWRLVLPVVGASSLVFFGWEALLFLRYGKSHFWVQILGAAPSPYPSLRRLELVTRGLVMNVGATMPGLALLAAAPVIVRSWRRVLSVGLVLTGFVMVGLLRSPEVPEYVFQVFGGAVLLSCFAAVFRLIRTPEPGQGSGERSVTSRRDDIFVMAWPLLEVLISVAISPFPAVRRVLGVIVGYVALLGRGIERRAEEPPVRWAWALACLSAFLGLVFFVVDMKEANGEREAVRTASRYIAVRDPDARVWFANSWGFHYYSKLAGFRKVSPGRSVMQEGDWLTIIPAHVHRQSINLSDTRLQLVADFILQDDIPFRTGYKFYAGTHPLAWCNQPRFRLQIYRCREKLVAPWLVSP